MEEPKDTFSRCAAQIMGDYLKNGRLFDDMGDYLKINIQASINIMRILYL